MPALVQAKDKNKRSGSNQQETMSFSIEKEQRKIRISRRILGLRSGYRWMRILARIFIVSVVYLRDHVCAMNKSMARLDCEASLRQESESPEDARFLF